ncbi:MAG: amidohydrolase/deacetylase family metallohydrolase [Anaerolineae bacterium]|nr:amidohydrolase/deacetylase family metallohydrolase [Anaerolineae bacterium]
MTIGSNPTPYDLLLKGGHVIDPKNRLDDRRDVAIAGGLIASVEPDINPTLARRVVDVSGYYVTPGLLDIHMHAYHTRAPEGRPEGLSVVADAHTFRSGVTTVVDTGTAGANHLRHFKETVIDRAKTRIFAYVNISDNGMLGEWEQDPRTFDAERAAEAVLTYPDICIGIKTAHYWTRLPWDDLHTPWAAVDRAIQAAELCGRHVMYDFWPRPPERSYEELILKKARPGDIHTHVYAQQFPIINSAGRVNDFMFEARARGVIFDVGHGAASFWFRNAVRAIQNGFPPDSISTDLHTGNVHGVVVDMQTTMNKILNAGMSLYDVIKLSTINPANQIGHPELGHLSIGACADVAVFNLQTGRFSFVDCGRAKLTGDKKLECAMTIRAGEIVFDIGGLSAPEWTDAPPEYWIIPDLQSA